MSSVTEGLGTSLLDAMACASRSSPRRPAAFRDRRGQRERPLVPPRDQTALANAIVRALNDAGLPEDG
jgi:hypothetical protein